MAVAARASQPCALHLPDAPEGEPKVERKRLCRAAISSVASASLRANHILTRWSKKPAIRSLVGAPLSFRKTAQIFQDCDGVLRDFRRTSVRSGSTLPNQTA